MVEYITWIDGEKSRALFSVTHAGDRIAGISKPV